MLTLKSKDPCIKSQLHLVFLGKEPEEVALESVLVHAAVMHWQADWPWRPQSELAELKCMKSPQAPPELAMGLSSSPCVATLTPV